MQKKFSVPKQKKPVSLEAEEKPVVDKKDVNAKLKELRMEKVAKLSKDKNKKQEVTKEDSKTQKRKAPPLRQIDASKTSAGGSAQTCAKKGKVDKNAPAKMKLGLLSDLFSILFYLSYS